MATHGPDGFPAQEPLGERLRVRLFDVERLLVAEAEAAFSAGGGTGRLYPDRLVDEGDYILSRDDGREWLVRASAPDASGMFIATLDGSPFT